LERRLARMQGGQSRSNPGETKESLTEKKL
jgi:hypothetical protein